MPVTGPGTREPAKINCARLPCPGDTITPSGAGLNSQRHRRARPNSRSNYFFPARWRSGWIYMCVMWGTKPEISVLSDRIDAPFKQQRQTGSFIKWDRDRDWQTGRQIHTRTHTHTHAHTCISSTNTNTCEHVMMSSHASHSPLPLNPNFSEVTFNRIRLALRRITRQYNF